MSLSVTNLTIRVVDGGADLLRVLYVRGARSASAAEIVEAIGLVKPRHACTLFVEIWLRDRDSNPEPCG